MAISGASGAIYGIRILEELKKEQVETHLVVSEWAENTIKTETDYALAEVREMASFCHEENNFYAPMASGSARFNGMIVAPCSMKTLAAIANGYTDNLINRAADVMIKEKRPLVLMVRETPLNPIHLENMLKLARLGVTIMPPVPAFYNKPETTEDIVTQTVGRVLDQFDIQLSSLKRWGQENEC